MNARTDSDAAAYARRKAFDVVFRAACAGALLLALLPLASVLFHTAARGIGGIDLAFFTQLPKPVGETGGGMANAIDGTLKLVALACTLGIPVGVLAGVPAWAYHLRSTKRKIVNLRRLNSARSGSLRCPS